MMSKKIFLVVLCCTSINAMDDNPQHAENNGTEHSNFRIDEVIPSSKYGWGSFGLLSHFVPSYMDNYLGPVTRLETMIYAHDGQDDAQYYCLHKRKSPDGTYLLTNKDATLSFSLPCYPHEVALNRPGTILLVDGVWDQVRRYGQFEDHALHHVLLACALKTKKVYELGDYKAGYCASSIGFGDDRTAVAEFNLSHQEWDLSVIEQ